MTQNYFTPIVNGDPRKNDASIWNDPLGELDAQLGTLDTQDQTLQDALNAIILDDGTGNAEVIAARTSINYKSGTPPALLSNALEWAALDIANVLAFGAVGNGIANDTAAIQNAITNNDLIYFPPGNYLISAGGLTIPSNRTLFSNGNVNINVDGGAVYCFTLEGGNITLRNLTIQGVSQDEIALKLYMNGSDLSNVTIDNCTFDNLGYGIRFAADQAGRTASRIRITNCNFNDIANRAIGMLQSPGTDVYTITDIRIEGNRFEDVAPDSSGKGGASGAFAGAIYIGSITEVARLYLVNNIALRCGPMFFAMSGTSASRTDFFVTGNVVRQVGTSVIVNMSYQFETVDNLIFDGNTCSYVDFEHLFIRNCKNFKIANSHFERANVGIAIVDSTYYNRSWGEITNCTFQDVECPSLENSGNKGIYIVSDSAEVDISNCNFIKQTGTKAQVGIDTNYQNTSSGTRAMWARLFDTTNYTWTSTTGSRYYLRRAGNVDPRMPPPLAVYENPDGTASALAAGTIGSLTAGQWAWGDDNSLGYKTIYVRLAGSGVPGNGKVSAAYAKLGLNISHCRFGRQSIGANIGSGGSITVFSHAALTSCVFIGCDTGINLANTVGSLVAYCSFNGGIADVKTGTDLNNLRACYNVHMNTNPMNAAAGGAYVIEISTNDSIWEISSCVFRGVLGVHIFAGGSFSQRKRMLIFRDNDVDAISTGLPSNIGVISMITGAQTIMGHFSAKASANSEWVNGDTIFNSAPAAAGATLGWINVGSGSGNSRPMQAQAHYGSGAVAPSANATFIGEEYLDTVALRWYKAITTGSGSSDWRALN